tara:strand:+ start:515 stop:694 length:180 start_codon:yes stop_codon:yes gene_type:complete
MYSEVVQSINIMIGLLLAGVSATIVWIFKYDDWYPNTLNDIHVSESDDSGHEELGSRTE